MTDELDPYEWHLSRELGMTREAMIETMTNHEYLSHMAFDEYAAAQAELARKERA